MTSLKDLAEKLNPVCRESLERAAYLCKSKTHFVLEIEHWLTTLLESDANDVSFILRAYDVDVDGMKRSIAESLDRLKVGCTGTPSMSEEIASLLERAWYESSLTLRSGQIRSGGVILGLLAAPVPRIGRQLEAIDRSDLASRFFDLVAGSDETEAEADPSEEPPIFLCYRRDDTRATVERIADHLASALGEGCVFQDVEGIPPGVDFRSHLDRQVRECRVFLPVIGPAWCDARDEEGRRRLELENDFVRLEIEIALSCESTIIPLLLREARIPDPDKLPGSIRDLAYRQGIPIRPNPDFRTDMNRLLERITPLIKIS